MLPYRRRAHLRKSASFQTIFEQISTNHKNNAKFNLKLHLLGVSQRSSRPAIPSVSTSRGRAAHAERQRLAAAVTGRKPTSRTARTTSKKVVSTAVPPFSWQGR